jgi:hypothetical protein
VSPWIPSGLQNGPPSETLKTETLEMAVHAEASKALIVLKETAMLADCCGMVSSKKMRVVQLWR